MRRLLDYFGLVWLPRQGDRAAYDAWERAQRRHLGRRAGLKFWRWTPPEGEHLPGGRLTIASRHWPHLLCWSWFVSWTPYRGSGYDGPRRFRISRYALPRQIHLVTPLGSLSWHQQNASDMVAVGIDRDAVPMIRYVGGGRGGGNLGETEAERRYRRFERG